MKTKTKICKKCHREKSLSQFRSYKRGSKKQARPECRECELKDKKKYRDSHKKQMSDEFKRWTNKGDNRQKRIEYCREWRKKNPDYRRQYMLNYHYGMSLEEHKQMYVEQNGCCAICSEPVEYNKIHTDHDHKTGKVRGLLCAGCNHFLSALDNIEFFNSALDYLNGHK